MGQDILESSRQRSYLISGAIHAVAFISLMTASLNLARKGNPDGGRVEFSTVSDIDVPPAPRPPKVLVPELPAKKVSPKPTKVVAAKRVTVAKPVARIAKKKAAPPVMLPVKTKTTVSRPMETVEESPVETKVAPVVAVEPADEAELPKPEPSREAIESEIANLKETQPLPMATDMEEEGAAEDLPARPALAQTKGAPSNDIVAGNGGMQGSAAGVRSDRELTAYPGNPAGIYPPLARLKRVEGVAVVDFDVDPQGRVSNSRLFKSSGNSMLDQEALTTQSKWRYQPGKVGTFRKLWVFKLTGEAREMHYQLGRRTTSR